MNYLGLLTPFTALVLYFSYNGHGVFAGVAFAALVMLAILEIVVSRVPISPRATFLPPTVESGVKLFADQTRGGNLS